ncbi:MAG: nucleotidyltransferase domain-containing protein, partial [Candidatus Woesearchaeota archaeon]
AEEDKLINSLTPIPVSNKGIVAPGGMGFLCQKKIGLYINVPFMQHMLQIRNDFEIVEILRKESSHIRDIAGKLKMVPSTVMRTLKFLQKEKVVDLKKEGKNSKYFLKDTLEATAYLYLSENYKLLKVLEDPVLRRVIKELKAATSGELIILFGSYAKKNAASTSDIDIYVETSDKSLKQRLEKISGKLSIKIGNFNKEVSLAKEIIRNHIIIQNVERFYQLLK